MDALSIKLKVTGCDLLSAGDFAAGEPREDTVFRDPSRGTYKRPVIAENPFVGAVMYGGTDDSNWCFGLIKDRKLIEEMRETLSFGPALQRSAGVSQSPMAAVAALPPDAEICGTCTGLVEQVLAASKGDSFEMPTEKPICKCTEQTHEDVRRLIKARAISFHLPADWPLEYQDDPAITAGERANHAKIQKEGTYSVMPRMWGEVTAPQGLTAIAKAARKYDAKCKVTGGQPVHRNSMGQVRQPVLRLLGRYRCGCAAELPYGFRETTSEHAFFANAKHARSPPRTVASGAIPGDGLKTIIEARPTQRCGHTRSLSSSQPRRPWQNCLQNLRYPRSTAP